MEFSKKQKKLIGCLYLLAAFIFISFVLFLGANFLVNNYTEATSEYAAYTDLATRKKNIKELSQAKSTLEFDLNSRSDIFLCKNINEGYVFFEKGMAELTSKHRGNIISSTRLSYKEVNEIFPLGYRVTVRLKDSDLAAFFLELDNNLLKKSSIEKIGIKPAYPGRMDYEPPVDVSMDLVMFCKKTGDL